MYFISGVIIFFIDTLLFTISSTISYSNLDFCVKNKILTSCSERSSTTPSSGCVDYEQTIKSESEKQAVLDRINSRRNKVASGEIRSLPSANNMQKLRWSNDLEELAQKWANQCVEGSVPDLKDDCLDPSIGQNVATVYGDAPGIVPQSLVDVWYMELLHMNASVIYQYKPSLPSTLTYYDHFTQLIWASTAEVGCSAARFKECVEERDCEKNITVYRLVCNFSPGGNIPNEEIYEIGPPCSQCPLQNSCDPKFKSLCLSDEPVSVTINESIKQNQEINNIQPKVTEMDIDIENGRDDILPSFLSNLHLSIPSITIPTTTHKTIFITNGLKVDDLVEIVKKKLSTDTIFKNIMASKTPQAEGEFLDPKVKEFAGQIYTTKVPLNTTLVTNKEYVNSTLLVDLIEAVIFRNAQKSDVVVTTTESLKLMQNDFLILPTKIQAELAEIPTNKYFTGHFFIPEEMDDASTKLTTETDYESYADKTTQIPITDILSEIENIRKQKVTRDFLSELLESEYVTERAEAPAFIDPDTHKTTSFVARKKRYSFMDYKYGKSNLKTFKYSMDIKANDHDYGYVIKYSELLKQLAADINALKLREQFACSSGMNKSNTFKNSDLYMYVLFLVFIMDSYL